MNSKKYTEEEAKKRHLDRNKKYRNSKKEYRMRKKTQRCVQCFIDKKKEKAFVKLLKRDGFSKSGWVKQKIDEYLEENNVKL